MDQLRQPNQTCQPTAEVVINHYFIKLISALFATTLGAVPGISGAEGFSAVASVSSNYAYRGYSKSNNGPIGQLNLDYGHRSGWFVGTWLSRVDFADSGYPDRSNIEIYPYLGYGTKLAEDWHLEASLSRYVFDGLIFGQYSDYNEYKLGAHWRDLLSVKLSFSDDGYHRGGAIVNGEVTGRYPIMANLSVSGGVAYNHIEVSLAESALYWNLGLTWYFKYGAVDIRYVDTAEIPTPSAAEAGPALPDLLQNFMGSVSIGF